MGRLTMVVCFVVIPLLWNVSPVSAQFFEAGVQKLEPPIKAPDFALKELGGREVSLSAFKGKVVLLNFFLLRAQFARNRPLPLANWTRSLRARTSFFRLQPFEGREKELWE